MDYGRITKRDDGIHVFHDWARYDTLGTAFVRGARDEAHAKEQFDRLVERDEVFQKR